MTVIIHLVGRKKKKEERKLRKPINEFSPINTLISAILFSLSFLPTK
jgi:hypothetical protein